MKTENWVAMDSYVRSIANIVRRTHQGRFHQLVIKAYLTEETLT